MKQISDLFRSFTKPTLDFMDIPGKKDIACMVAPDDCIGCGNCENCPYLAIKLDEKGKITVDPHRCMGCTLCTMRCPGKCLGMRARKD